MAAKEKILGILADEPSPQALNSALRYLAKCWANLFENTLVAQERPTLKSGPSAGMIYNVAASGGCRVPRLLGCYEKTLEPIIETITAAASTLIINIGCAAGYYAVGLARHLPNTIVWTRDSDKIACEKCMALAATNHVDGPVTVGAN